MAVLSEVELEELRSQPAESAWIQDDGTLVIRAPTWAMRPNQKPFDLFVPDLQNPERSVRARRDYACKATSAIRPFFPNVSIIDDNAQQQKEFPFTSLSWVKEPWPFSRETLHPETGQTATEYIAGFIKPYFKPKIGAVYYGAGDLSVSKDATGVALVHANIDGSIEVDFSFHIETIGKMIDYRPIRHLFAVLRTLGFTIGCVGFDQFQSHDSVIIISEELGIPSKVVKYSDSFAGCNVLATMMSTKKLIYGSPAEDRFIQEAKELQVIGERRVDHLKSGGIVNAKDTWDAVVNATVICIEDKRTSTDDVVLEGDLVEFDRGPLYSSDNNNHSLIFGVNSRFNLEVDSTEVSIAVVAINSATGWILLLGAKSIRSTLEDLEDHLLKIHSEFSGNFSNKKELANIILDNRPYSDNLSKKLRKAGFSVTVSKQSLKPAAKIPKLKTLAKERVLRFLRDYKDVLGYRDVVQDLLSFPFIHKTYLLEAVELAASVAESVKKVEPRKVKAVHSIKSTSDW